jgi:hypothetical protein
MRPFPGFAAKELKAMLKEAPLYSRCKLALALLLAVSATAGEPPIGVCEIVQHSERYRNKVVIVTGRYFHGPHGATIANEECGFQSRYRPFGSGAALDAQNYDQSEAQPDGADNFVDQHSIQAFERAVAKAMMDSKLVDQDISVTVVGLVKVANKYTLQKSHDGGYTGTGYGFMGRYPVQIQLLQVKKFQISDVKK